MLPIQKLENTMHSNLQSYTKAVKCPFTLMLITARPSCGCVCAYRCVPVWQVIEVRAEAAYMTAAGLMEQLSLRRS